MTKISKRLIFGLAFLLSLRLNGEKTSGPDPNLLLEGVVSAREQIPPSRLYIHAICEGPFSHWQGDYMVLFNREFRHFASTNSGSKTRMMFDGKEVFYYTGGSTVDVRNLDGGTPDYVFDPRVLGLTTTYACDETIHGLLRLGTSRVELVGSDRLNGKESWHVRMIEPNGVQVDIWIDEKNCFSVYRIDEKLPGVLYRTMRSYYDNPRYPSLPSRVEGEAFDGKGNLRTKRQVAVLTAEANVKIPEKTWTLAGLLAGLNLPDLVGVNDARTLKIIGFWHNGRLGPPVPWEDPPARPRLTARRFLLIAVMALFLSAPVIIIAYLKGLRGKRNRSSSG